MAFEQPKLAFYLTAEDLLAAMLAVNLQLLLVMIRMKVLVLILNLVLICIERATDLDALMRPEAFRNRL